MYKYLSILLSLTFLLGCTENSNEPNLNSSIEDVPQKKIVWTSLANTPWPMYHHDPQLTGRSEYAGPKNGLIESIKFENCRMTMSGISIGYNNTAYLPSGDISETFFAFDFSGNIKWESQTSSTSTALITSDSLIILPTIYNSLTTYSLSGDTVWNSKINIMNNLGMNIDRLGNVYLIDAENWGDTHGSLKSFDKNGNLLWTFFDERINTSDAVPSFSPDGSTIYLQGSTVSLLAVDIASKTVKWTFGNKRLSSAPVVDNEGNIYILPGESGSINYVIYSLDEAGVINWEFASKTSGLFDNIEPTIDWNGNIYFGCDTLYSFTNSGKLRWAKELEGNISSALVCDKDNDIYFSISPDNIYSFHSDGEIKWIIKDLPFRTVGSCPAITNDGKLLFPSWRNNQISLSIVK
ncbi:MAG: PQQ-binding-like beta-propeller repeat protein [Bacteroidetes bacterium]|nr:PQQ-binding-like beta-propeller repeat protein [Bacteroidota bacterium]